MEILFGVLRVPLDACAVLGALTLAYVLRERSIDLLPGIQLLEPATTLPPFAVYLSDFTLASIVAVIALSAMLGLYTLTAVRSAWREIGRTIVVALLWLTLVIAWYFLVRKQLFYSRILLLHAAFFLALFAVLGRSLLILLQRLLLTYGYGSRVVVTIGAHAPPPAARDVLEHDVRYVYRGHCRSIAAGHWTGDDRPDLIIQTDANPDSDDTVRLIEFCRSRHIGYAFLPPVLTDVPHLLAAERLGLLPLLRFHPTPLDGWGRVWKACFDAVASSALLLALSPLLVLIALAILLDDGWPVFYVSRRVGERAAGRIPVLKFRTMVKDADRRKAELEALNHRRDGPLFKMRDDPRVTRVGRVLRRWSLDEFPQLLNVLAGQMALVGPRPHLPEEVRRYTDEQHRVFAVRPGMTGLAQISGRSDLSFDEEVAHDLRYIEEWSPLLDLWILWRTGVVVLGRKGAD